MTAEFLLEQHALCTGSEGDKLDLRPHPKQAGSWLAASPRLGTQLDADDLAAIRVWIDQQIGPPKLLAAAEHLVEDIVIADGDQDRFNEALTRFVESIT